MTGYELHHLQRAKRVQIHAVLASGTADDGPSDVRDFKACMGGRGMPLAGPDLSQWGTLTGVRIFLYEVNYTETMLPVTESVFCGLGSRDGWLWGPIISHCDE